MKQAAEKNDWITAPTPGAQRVRRKKSVELMCHLYKGLANLFLC